MKRLITLLLFMMGIIPFVGIAQSTTEDEFAYLTKGIRDQKIKGLDLHKEGYKLTKFYEFDTKENETPGSYPIYTFRKFLDSDGVLKAISIEYSTPGNPKGVFSCYPLNNEKLLKEFTARYKGSSEILLAAMAALVNELQVN